jgi:nucleotide-binding universal stress UspA family protein
VRSESGVRSAVVGLDGSSASRAALEWACDGLHTDDTVHAIHVRSDDASAARVDLEGWVAASSTGKASIRPVVLVGDPAERLLQAADDLGADLVAVGTHGQSDPLPQRIGHVARELLRHTRAPIAIVGDHVSTPATNTVVAGVGHGAATRAALGWAATYAVDHGTGLKLIRAVPDRPLFRSDGLLDVMAWYIDRDMATGWALEDLEAAADAIERSTDDDLTISWAAPSGSPGSVLTDTSVGASLLVVGLHEDDDDSTVDHDVPRWLHRVITHAPCPVVVVPVPH